jgi:hypothetical protein
MSKQGVTLEEYQSSERTEVGDLVLALELCGTESS